MYTPTLGSLFVESLGNITDYLGITTLPVIDLPYLRSLPVGTFGRAWADFLDENHLSPLQKGARRLQIHDGVHVLTDYPTSPLGEAQVQAFLIGSHFRISHLTLLCVLLLRLRYLYAFPYLCQVLQESFSRGKRATFDLACWEPELLWNTPLAKVRADLLGEIHSQM